MSVFFSNTTTGHGTVWMLSRFFALLLVGTYSIPPKISYLFLEFCPYQPLVTFNLLFGN